MNNFIYPPQNNYYQIIIEELRRINDTLKKIDNKLNETHKKQDKGNDIITITTPYIIRK